MSVLTRRAFVGGAVAGAGTFALHAANARATTFLPYPFTLGVASGDPVSDGIVLWTRLAPKPLEGGGMPRLPIPVLYEIAEDERCRRVVRRGIELTLPEHAHTVHADVRGLKPGREYFYRFIVGRHDSPIGRTVTAPSLHGSTKRLRFAFASCQDWQNGYYSAYGDMAKQDLDLVVHLGDYIYEYAADPAGPRAHLGDEVESLESYRNRYAQYRTDSQLQAVHARFPFIVTPDDHEVENNYADEIREEGANANTIPFALRRANAYRAYWEHMPLRAAQRARGADIQLYRSFNWGDLASFQVLDTRQYRSDQPCGDGLKPRCAAALADSQTMTGPEQERWLLEGLHRSRAKWNVIAQQTQFSQIDFNPLPGPGANELFIMDQWDGYVAARNRILSFLQRRRPSNPVIITGDIHSSWVHDIKADFADPASATLATEFVGTSITSDFRLR